MKLQAVTLRIADRRSAGTARALRPAAGDLVLGVGGELAGQVEVVAVAGATKREIDFVQVAAARMISRIAADALGRAIAGLERSGPGPGAVKFLEWSVVRPRR